MTFKQKLICMFLSILISGLMLGMAIAAPKDNFVQPLPIREVTMDLTQIDQFDYELSNQGACYYFRPTSTGKYDFLLLSSSYDIHAVLFELDDTKTLTGKSIELGRGGTDIRKSVDLKRSARYMLVVGKKIEMANGRIANIEPLTGKLQVQVMYATTGHTLNKPFKLALDQELKERIRTPNQTDFYRFTAPYNGEYTFNATDQMTLQLLDSRGALIGNAGIHQLSRGEVYYLRTFKENSQLTGYKIKATLSRADEAVPVKAVKLNVTKKEILHGRTFELKAKTSPVYAANHTVKWKSLHPHIATVDKNGLVKAIMPGVATITATSVSGVTITCQIKVTPIKVKSISIKTKLTLEAKKTQTLEVKFSPANASIKVVKWTSSNPKVATVDAKGKVKALKPGKAVITAVAKDGNRKSRCTITVVNTGAKIGK